MMQDARICLSIFSFSSSDVIAGIDVAVAGRLQQAPATEGEVAPMMTLETMRPETRQNRMRTMQQTSARRSKRARTTQRQRSNDMRTTAMMMVMTRTPCLSRMPEDFLNSCPVPRGPGRGEKNSRTLGLKSFLVVGIPDKGIGPTARGLPPRAQTKTINPGPVRCA